MRTLAPKIGFELISRDIASTLYESFANVKPNIIHVGSWHLQSESIRRTSGAALIIVLGYVVLLTIIVVAYLSRVESATNSSATSGGILQCNLLAQTAVQTLVGDIRDEMIAGAVNNPQVSLTTGLVDPMEVCPINADTAQPEYANAPANSEWAAVPERVVAGTIPAYNPTNAASASYANLIKQSLSGEPFYGSGSSPITYTAKNMGGAVKGVSRATNVSTTVPSTDGRFISPTRWSTSGLLGTDLTSAQTPSWIYINRRGLLTDGTVLNNSTGVTTASNPTANNENFVIGRVAYNIYDTGGLLNVNVVGFPQAFSQSTEGINTIYHKGSPAWADGTVLGMSAQQITNLVAFRNSVSATTTQSSVTPFDNFVHNWAEMQGFLSPFPNSTSAPTSTDGFFFGRQDLIKYWLYANGAASYNDLVQNQPAQRAILAQLTGFSAFSTTPSEFTGDAVSGVTRPNILPYTASSASSVAGGNDYTGNDPSTGKKWRYTINPYNPGVRPTKAGFTRYRKTPGVTTTSGVFTRQVPAQKNDVLVNSRFPLSRIALITGGGTDATAIYNYFGLTKDPQNTGAWIYYHGKVTSAGAPDYGHIESLPEVADPTTVFAGSNVAPREPDFFELLQASIDIGSIGKACGTAGGGTNLYQRDIVAQFQIMQIGANIISQADPGAVPTQIEFNPAAPGTATPSYRIFSGVKNLPYLSRVRAIMVQTAGAPVNNNSPPDSSGNPTFVYGIFLQPEVWNPHDTTSIPPPTGTPGYFRVVADTNGLTQLYGSCNSDPSFNDARYLSPDGNLSRAGSYATGIDFTSSLPVTEPVLLSRTIPGLIYADANNTTGAPLNTSNLLGMCASTLKVSTTPLTMGQNFALNSTGGLDGSTLTMKMQYATASTGPWTTYATYEYCPVTAASGLSNAAPDEDTVSVYNAAMKSLCADPRTNRFGWWVINGIESDGTNIASTAYPFNTSSAYNLAIKYTASGYTIRTDAAAGSGTGYGSWTVDYAAGNSRNQYPTPENCGWTLGAQNPANAYTGGSVALATIDANKKGNVTYYADADGICRGGDGFYNTGGASTIGLMLAATNTTSRPIVLNRPFESVGELGYVFRDTPGKSLDFLTPDSGDAGLLDNFCIDEQPDNGVVTGHVSLNTHQPNVLAAVMAKTMCVEPNQTAGADIDQPTQQQAIATAIATLTSGTGTGQGPVANRNEIATRIIPALNAQFGGTSNGSTAKNWIIKRRAETVVRALADSTEAGTWNLMVDMVVQSGRFPKNQTNASAGNFVVSGETRQWVHLAIERSTGKVIASLVEPVYE